MFSKALKDKPDLLKYFNQELKGLSPGQIVQEIEFLEKIGFDQSLSVKIENTNQHISNDVAKHLLIKTK